MKTDKNAALEIARSMRRIRTVEETIAGRYSEQEMRCPTHLSIGQEGVAAAVGQVLRKTDLAVSGHRAHAHYLAKGGNLPAMIAELYGRVTGCARGKGGSMHLIDEDAGFMGSTAIVGGTVPVGVGLGYALSLEGGDSIACIFIGDAVVETGVFYEAANFAVLKQLPVLFLCENNFYSVYSPLQVRQTLHRPIHERVSGLGLQTGYGHGSDVAGVYETVLETVNRIRAGNGPVFLQCDTYRWREHCGPNFDNDLGYRPEAEVRHWDTQDPIPLHETACKDAGILDETAISKMQNDIDNEVAAAFDFAIGSDFPGKDEAFKHVFAGNAAGE